MVSSQPADEPTITVNIEDKNYQFMVDTGATYSCIGSDGHNMPLSGSLIKTQGFSGKTMTVPLTKPVNVTIAGKTIRRPLLYAVNTPINLLGRDILCPLKANILCTREGICVDIPDEVTCKLMMLSEDKSKPEVNRTVIYWLRWPCESKLLQEWEIWRDFVIERISQANEPSMPLHCTLYYDKTGEDLDYEECWDEIINSKVFELDAVNIYVGPEGAAAAINLSPALQPWFRVCDSYPHVTLWVAEGRKPQELGPMVKSAMAIDAWQSTQEINVWTSPDDQYVKIAVQMCDRVVAEKILKDRFVTKQLGLSDKHAELLKQIPEQLWSKHKTDIGLVKSAEPVKVQLRPGVNLPHKKQYPLSQEAINGIRPTIKGLVDAGVLYHTTSVCNTPIFPIKKPNGQDYRLVHDLRAINAIVEDNIAIVPDPYTLLSNVPHDARWYTVIDLCSAYFSVPLHPDSQYLFAFTFPDENGRNQQYTYRSLAQGFCDAPRLFNSILFKDLQHINVESTVIQYVDDILLASRTEAECERDSIIVLTALAHGGHKVNRDKLQFCQEKVEYLGRLLCGDQKGIAPSQIEAIIKLPKPQTVGQMLTFLGMTGFCRTWVCDYAIKAAPLRAMIKIAGQKNSKAALQWTDEADHSFNTLKEGLASAPALGHPDYSKIFYLYVAEKSGFACAVLAQDADTGKKPLAYYSTKLDNIEAGLPPCYQGLAAAAFAFEKASVLTMGHKVIMYTTHQLHALLTSPQFVLTHARKTGYEVILSAPELVIKRCTSINPAMRMMTPEDGKAHDCVQSTQSFLKLREDMYDQPIAAEITLFVDGSCFRNAEGLHAGYAVVTLNPDDTYTVIEAAKLPQPCSAQLAEIKALTAAFIIAEGKKVNVYTDSSYAYYICHLYASVWSQRLFKRSDGSKVAHETAIQALLEAIMLPREVAVIKCAAHQKIDTVIAKGNNMADQAAKNVTMPTYQGVVVVEDADNLFSLKSLIEAQSNASPQEQSAWIKRGAMRERRSGMEEGLWRNSQGKLVLPGSLLKIAIREAHGADHCSRGEVARRLGKVWWCPFLIPSIERILNECGICAQYNVRKNITSPIAHIPIPDGPFRHLVMDHVDMLERVNGYRYILVVVDIYSRWIEAVATRKQDAKSAANFLCKEVFPRFGFPDTISSDNGPAFVSDLLHNSLALLGIKLRHGCIYAPRSQSNAERANGILKAKLAKIIADSGHTLSWLQALPIALTYMRMSVNRTTHLTPHEMITGRPMPLPLNRGPYKGPPLEQCENELKCYLQHLTKIHKFIFQQVKGATEDRDAEIPVQARQIEPGDYVYVRVYRRKWNEGRREGPFRVILATPTAVKVAGRKFWYHLNHCYKAQQPEVTTQNTQTPRDGDASLKDTSQDQGTATPPCKETSQQEGDQASLQEPTEQEDEDNDLQDPHILRRSKRLADREKRITKQADSVQGTEASTSETGINNGEGAISNTTTSCQVTEGGEIQKSK